MESHLHIMASLTLIGLLGLAAQLLAWRLRFPAIVFLLLFGILAGPVTGWLDPGALFGDLLFPLVTLAVAIILFEGSLTLKFEDTRNLGRVITRLVGPGALISASVAMLASILFAGFEWRLALVFGTLMIVTGPTVVVPMLRAIRPTRQVSNILRWEGIVIDPVGALLTVLAFDFVVASSVADVGHALTLFLTMVISGSVIGIAAGYGLGFALQRHWIPEYLINVVTFNLVIGAFVLSHVFAEESGLLAVTLMGIVLANMKQVPVTQILHFKESVTLLLVSALFIILAARIDPDAFVRLGWGAVAVFLALQFIGRPLKVLFAAAGSDLRWQERVLLAWIGPRGIVAAAIAALLSIKLEAVGFAGADLLVPLTFTMIIATVTVQGATSRWLANRLGVSEPEPTGLLIIGANRLSRAIAKALNDNGFSTLLADSHKDNIRDARMEGLRTYYGNPVSERADHILDLVGIGRMLGLSPDPEANALASIRYKTEFGAAEIFSIQSSVDLSDEKRRMVSREFRGKLLFGEEISYQVLDKMLQNGATMRETRLSETFDFQDFIRTHWKRAVPLFAIDPKGRLRPFLVEQSLEPEKEWTILALVEPELTKENSVRNNDDATDQ